MSNDSAFFLEAMRRRYACKLFDPARPLSAVDIDYILECGRLSPSSFGLEHWQFYAVTSPEKQAALYQACFQQECVRTSALSVVAVTRRAAAYKPDSSFITERGSRFPGGLEVFVADYSGYYDYLEQNGLLDQWARAQCYIACANMMTGAAAAAIDSCAIEGYDNDKVLALLGLESGDWQTGIITVFGYRAEAARQKIRMPKERIIINV